MWWIHITIYLWNNGKYFSWHVIIMVKSIISGVCMWDPHQSIVVVDDALVVSVTLMLINTLRPRQYGRYFADDTFNWIFFSENVWTSIKISLKFVCKGSINYILALVQLMAWHRPGNKPLSEPVMARLLMHVCITRPQWVKMCFHLYIISYIQTFGLCIFCRTRKIILDYLVISVSHIKTNASMYYV